MVTSARAARTERIVAAALEVFRERGYAAATTAEIARTAKTSKETIYGYFGDKAGLFRATLTSLVATPARDEVPVLSSGDPRSALIGLARTLIAELMNPDYLKIVRIVIAEGVRDPELITVFRESIVERLLNGVGGVTSRITDARPGLSDDTIARGFIGPLLTHVLLGGLLRPPEELRVPTDDEIVAQVDLFLEGAGED